MAVCLESVYLPEGTVTATTVHDKYCFVFSLSFAKAVVVLLVPQSAVLSFPGLPKMLPLLALGT